MTVEELYEWIKNAIEENPPGDDERYERVGFVPIQERDIMVILAEGDFERFSERVEAVIGEWDAKVVGLQIQASKDGDERIVAIACNARLVMLGAARICPEGTLRWEEGLTETLEGPFKRLQEALR